MKESANAVQDITKTDFCGGICYMVPEKYNCHLVRGALVHIATSDKIEKTLCGLDIKASGIPWKNNVKLPFRGMKRCPGCQEQLVKQGGKQIPTCDECGGELELIYYIGRYKCKGCGVTYHPAGLRGKI